MRWIYRAEMRLLFALEGFKVVAEYSDFHKAPPAYGKEQIWACRADRALAGEQEAGHA